jgi:hypothetical protein
VSTSCFLAVGGVTWLTSPYPQPTDEATAAAVLPAKRMREQAPAAPPPPAAAAASVAVATGSRKKSKRDEEAVEPNSNEEAADDFTSTRELVIRWEDERAMAEMAGKALAFAKEKTGYQLYHMHRVAEIKSMREPHTRKADGNVKHHEAFKKAARDWSKLPESEKEWYNNRADKKPMNRAPKHAGYDDINSLQVVDQAVNSLLHEVHVHQSNCVYMLDHVAVEMSAAHAHPLFDSPPRAHSPKELAAAAAAVAAVAATPGQKTPPAPRPPVSDSPPGGQPTGSSSEVWLCTNCSNGDATSASGLCLMCASFTPARDPFVEK